MRDLMQYNGGANGYNRLKRLDGDGRGGKVVEGDEGECYG